jgi:adenylate cyclase
MYYDFSFNQGFGASSLQTLGNANQSGDQKARLIISTIDKPEAVIELGDLLTIGRSPENQLVIDDKRASRSHAEIRRVGERYRLSDLGSSNGTWITGRRLTAPTDLENGDEILIGTVQLRFVAPAGKSDREVIPTTGTVLAMRHELVIVLVADIRNFTTMSESLPSSEFSRLISSWFREATDIIELNGGTIDKYIGDAVMAFWVVGRKADPAREARASLESARSLIARADHFSARFGEQFPGHSFRIGIGLNMGMAMMGNVGSGKNQSFTILGDCVNVAFRLEALSKQIGSPVIVARSLADISGATCGFRDLGQVEVKGRTEPIAICAMECEGDPPRSSPS